jgi:alpha-glucosidase (family GH31 glycosyl hydrolase)
MRSGQTYGHQPVYIAKSSSSPNFHLVYLKNTHGFNLQSSEQSKKLKYNIVGGHIHFIIILGTNPEELVKQYHNYIGPAMVPPFWSLGYHQSRWGYRNF